MSSVSLSGVATLLIFLGGFGLPLGVPPEPENPAMAHVAPEDCLLYTSWASMAKADRESGNHTEQLLAEPELQEFARSLERSIGLALRGQAQEGGDARAEQLGKIAPLWIRTVITRSTAIFATRLEVRENKLDVQGGMLVDAGEQAGELVEGLVQILSSEEARAEEVTIGRAKFFRFAPQANGIETEITLGAAGNFVLIGAGEGAVEGMIDRLRAKQTPQWLSDIAKRLPVDRRASVSYVNTKELVEGFLPMAGPQGARAAESLGVTELGDYISVTGLDKEGMVSRSLLKIEGKPRGLVSLVDGEALKPANVEFLPRDAAVASAFSLDAEQVYDIVERLVADTAPNESDGFQRMADEFEKQFGLRLKEDLLAALGDTWTVSLSPSDGLLTGLTATVDVRDAAVLQGVIQRALIMLGGSPDGRQPRIETTRFGKHQIQSIAMPGMPIRPSWCVTESRLIVSLFPQTVKGALSIPEDEQGLFRKPELAELFEGEGRTIAVSYQDTAKLFESAYSYASMALPMMFDAMGRDYRTGRINPPPFDIATLPSARSIHRHLQPSITVVRRTADGLETHTRQTFPGPNVGASAPVAVALLLPAVQSARTAARRSQSQNNLKQIMLAMHNHHDTMRSFPPAHSLDPDGKPLLSWRVKILPYIEQQALYNEFHHDEPWDSEHNKKLIAKMPETFKSPASKAGEGKTVYLGVSGPAGILPTPKPNADGTPNRGISMASVTDGTSNTIAVVEASDDAAVIWTRPGDYTPDEDEPLKGLVGLYPGGFNVGICDGSVRFISESIDPKTLMLYFMRNDGQPIQEGPRPAPPNVRFPPGAPRPRDLPPPRAVPMPPRR